MSEYQEFTGKTVEEALRNAREAFGVAVWTTSTSRSSPPAAAVCWAWAPSRHASLPRRAPRWVAPLRARGGSLEAAAGAAAARPRGSLPAIAARATRDRDRGPRDRGVTGSFERRPDRPDRARAHAIGRTAGRGRVAPAAGRRAPQDAGPSTRSHAAGRPPAERGPWRFRGRDRADRGPRDANRDRPAA